MLESVRKSAEHMLYLLPVIWMIAGAGFFVATRTVPAEFLTSSAIISVISSFALVQWLTHRMQILESLPRPDILTLLAMSPWIVANTRQLIPFWNDAANYAHSAHHLFAGSATLSQVMAISGPQNVVQGDFNGPGYVLLHWPIGVLSDVLPFTGSSMLAYSLVRVLQTISVLLVFQALRGSFGPAFALASSYVTFLFPWTNSILSGTHREWIILYAMTLLFLVVRHEGSASPALILVAALFFTQSHITTVLMLPALALFVAWRTKERATHVADSFARTAALMFGLAVGYSPLIIRVASGRISGTAALDELESVAPQALNRFDASRSRTLDFLGASLPLPPIPLSAILVVMAGVSASIWLLSVAPRSRYRAAAAAFLTYCLTFGLAFVGVMDRIVASAGFSPSWFTLEKLLGANNRYWFAVVMSALLMVGLALREPQSRIVLRLVMVGLALREPQSRVVLRLSSKVIAFASHSAVPVLVGALAVLSLVGGPVVVAVLHSRLAPLGELFMPGRRQVPVSIYLEQFERIYRFSVATLLAALVARVSAKSISGQARGVFDKAMRLVREARRFSASAEPVAVMGLLAALVAVPLAFAQDAMSYGRGTTASAAATVDFWDDVLADTSLGERCFIASSSSTTQAFINSRGTEHFNLNSGWAGPLWQSRDDFPVMDAENLPCILFGGGLFDFAPEDALWRSLYAQAVCDSRGICMYIDPQRVALASQLSAASAPN